MPHILNDAVTFVDAADNIILSPVDDMHRAFCRRYYRAAHARERDNVIFTPRARDAQTRRFSIHRGVAATRYVIRRARIITQHTRSAVANVIEVTIIASGQMAKMAVNEAFEFAAIPLPMISIEWPFDMMSRQKRGVNVMRVLRALICLRDTTR